MREAVAAQESDLDRFIGPRETETIAGYSMSQLERRMKESPPTFPLPVITALRSRRWSLREVKAWQAEQFRLRAERQARAEASTQRAAAA